MRCLTDVECVEWCKARGYKTRYVDVYGRFVPNVDRAATDVSVAANAAESLESIELGKSVAAHFGAESETLIWVTDWEADSDEGSLMSLLMDVRRSAGETRTLRRRPAASVLASSAGRLQN